MTTLGETITTTYYPNKYYEMTGATTTANIFLPTGELITTVSGDGTSTTTSYIHPDHLGGTNAVTDENGELAQTLDYYPFGAKRNASSLSFNLIHR